MEGFFLLLALIATIWVIYWSAVNDNRPEGKPVTGFFAYRPGREPAKRKPTTLMAKFRSPDPASPSER
jgi:hypothetical protein